MFHHAFYVNMGEIWMYLSWLIGNFQSSSLKMMETGQFQSQFTQISNLTSTNFIKKGKSFGTKNKAN